MNLALDEARAALDHDDVPVGAVVLRDGAVIAARHNERELTGDPTAHAEILAMRDASEQIGHWRLDDCTLVVTLEPCTMCAGAMVNAGSDTSSTAPPIRKPAQRAAGSTSSTVRFSITGSLARRMSWPTNAARSWSTSSAARRR